MNRLIHIFKITRKKRLVSYITVDQKTAIRDDFSRIRDMGLPIEWIHRAM